MKKCPDGRLISVAGHFYGIIFKEDSIVIYLVVTTFDYVWIMTQGGPAGSTEVFATRIYKTTFINYDAGYGAAMSLSVCILALSVYFVLKFIQKRGRE